MPGWETAQLERMGMGSGKPCSLPRWCVERLRPGASSISASRRTDILAFYSAWFAGRLAAGYADYQVRGRVFRASLLARDVTHITFWTRWPAPAYRLIEALRARGWPLLFNVTITGLGGTDLEPHVPSSEKAVEAVRRLSDLGVPPAAIQWRFDPIVLSRWIRADERRRTFAELARQLRGWVDRVAVSFVEPYPRQVLPDLRRWEQESGDGMVWPTSDEQAALAGELRSMATSLGLPFTVCCSPLLRKMLGCPASGCNDFAWALRAYPELRDCSPLPRKPTRPDCACCQERDIGRYDTCLFGCRYCYATRNLALARRYFSRHDPGAASL